jgi:micrococcal nuclease
MADDDINWNHVGYANTVPFIPPITRGKVIKVYDGDTLTIASRLPGNETLYRFSVRLGGIDCPEMKSKIASEKQVAQVAKEFVSHHVMNKVVELRHVEMEKYGRLLAQVYYKDNTGTLVCLNNQLCAERLAVAYDGGTKVSPENWVVYYQGN